MAEKNKKNILFVLPQLCAGGSERVVLELAENLDSSAFEVFTAFFKGGALEGPLGRICKGMFPIAKKEGFDSAAMRQLAGVIRANGIDVVNAHHYMPFFYSLPGSKVLNRARLVYTEHSIPEVRAVSASIHGKLLRGLLCQTDAVIGVSNEIGDEFRRLYPGHAGKVLSIPNGVDLGRYRPRGDGKEVRARWGLTPGEFVIGMVANFRKVKNHACLVRAVRRLKDRCPQVRIFFVGTGFPGDLENSAEEVAGLIRTGGLQDRVIFAGYQEDIPHMLSAFDVFCLPSFSEGLPVSVLEAMAAGVPVVGSRVRGITEVVRDGETGLLFPSDDDEALAALIAGLAADRTRLKRLAENARRHIRASHEIGHWADRYSKVLVGQHHNNSLLG